MFEIYQTCSACLAARRARMMDVMETESTQTNEQLASLDKRLTLVERNLAALTTEVAVLFKTVATKDDLAEVAAVTKTLATKDDLAKLAVLTSTMATKDDLKLLAVDVARIDATLVSLQENCATKADLLAQETRIMKWMIGTLIGVTTCTSALVVLLVKVLQI